MKSKTLYNMSGEASTDIAGSNVTGTTPRLSFKRSLKPEDKQIALKKYFETNPDVPLGGLNPNEPIGGRRPDNLQVMKQGGKLFTSLKKLNEKLLLTRQSWPRRFALLLTCFSASIGLGNVWRFPKIALENGSGAFLIAYVIVVILIAQPLHFLELSLGQFSSKGPIKVWKCFPVFRGVAYTQLVITLYLALNLSIVLSWSLFYLTESFRAKLPWGRHYFNQSLVENVTYAEYDNETTGTIVLMNSTKTTGMDIALKHWRECILQDTSSDSTMTTLNWKLGLFLLGIWLCIFFCLLPGIRSLRKMTYVTCVPPFIALTAMLVYLFVSKASPENIKNLLELLNPEWEHLKNIRVWYAACQQAFISLNLAFGQLILFSGFNEFEHSVIRDSFIICIFDTVVSILSSFAVFAVVGKTDRQAILDATGFGLSFVAYAAGIGRIKAVPQLWIFLLYLMIFFLGLGNLVSLMTSLLHVFEGKEQSGDETYDFKRKKKKRTWIISSALCLICFLIGLLFTTDVSLDILTALDIYGISFCVVLLAVLETIGIAWGYGMKRFAYDTECMFKSPLSYYWRINWSIFTPIVLTVLLIYVHVLRGMEWTPKNTTWPFVFGWTSAGVALALIPVGTVISFKKSALYGFRDRLRDICQAESYWGPMDPIHLRNWMRQKDASKSVTSSPKSTSHTPKGTHNIRMNGILTDKPLASSSTKSTPVLKNKAYINDGYENDEDIH